MMDKLISQQAAIDKIKKRLYETALNNVGIKQNIDETLVDVAENRLENWFGELPSVQPETNCSEIPNNSDTISRQAVTKFLNDWLSCLFENCHKQSASDLKMIIKDFKNLPSAEPEQHLDEWCVDCKEYDKEKHSCPRWNRVIRQTLLDAQPERKTGRWIPVSERLPKEGEVVLTQAKFKDDVKMAVSSRIDYNYWTTWGTRDINIVAWMPLPKPYQKRGEQDE